MIWALVGVALLAGACGGGDPETAEASPSSTPVAAPQDTSPSPTAAVAEAGVATETKDGSLLAPDFQGIGGWINTAPISLSDLRGKVVLVDFWTYTCVNCIRTYPFLREWHRKYADLGLVIVGVHTPEFEFERLAENVATAAAQHDLLYPIAQDNDYETFRAFSVQAWPTKFLVDQDGIIRYGHRGEGGYQETEATIRELLMETGADLDGVEAGTDTGPVVDLRAVGSDIATSLTRELYGGYARSVIGTGAYVINPEYYLALDRAIDYKDSGERVNHFIFLQGVWLNGRESLTHGRETEDFQDYIGIQFYARSVNVVINPDGEVPFDVLVTLDGLPLGEEVRGSDVTVNKDGDTVIVVDGPRIYNAVELPEFGGHELKLSPNSTAFRLYTFTFGAYEQGP